MPIPAALLCEGYQGRLESIEGRDLMPVSLDIRNFSPAFNQNILPTEKFIVFPGGRREFIQYGLQKNPFVVIYGFQEQDIVIAFFVRLNKEYIEKDRTFPLILILDAEKEFRRSASGTLEKAIFQTD